MFFFDFSVTIIIIIIISYLFMSKVYIDKLQKWHDKHEIASSLFDKDWNLCVEFIYKSKFENTKDLRDFVDILCWELKFTNKQKWRFILIADELNNNAIEYWSASTSFNILRMKSYVQDWQKYFNLEVEDNWDWKNPKKALDMETMRAHKLKLGYFWHNSIRWRWLFLIIVKLVDRLFFKNSKNKWLIVWIKTKI